MIYFECSSNNAPPVLDTTFAVTDVIGAVINGASDDPNGGPKMLLGLSAATLWAMSAYYGYSKTAECDVAKAELIGRLTRPVRPRRRYPAAPPSQPRDDGYLMPAPATMPPLPAAPVPAAPPAPSPNPEPNPVETAPVPQQSDEEVPGTRAKP